MPMLSMKTTKPMLDMPEMIDDAGLSSPNPPASRPSQPIQRGARGQQGGHRVQRTTTPHSRPLA